ncbi:MAG: glycosyltransferase, partial [Planctomycetales bacterium]|nr:glycosyltransferase [Planctomycetales bacterium]
MSSLGEDSRPKLTVALIVRDAAGLVAQTLSSVAQIADEIVVADTGSADNTREVAVRYGGRVIDVPWSSDFAAARNACLAAIESDWILGLDAGETLSPLAAARLRRFVDTGAEPASSYSLLVRLPPAPQDIAAPQIARLRLMPRRAQLRFRGRVREYLEDPLDPQGPKVQPLSLVVQRPACDQHVEVKLRKAQRNLQLAEREMREEGPAARLWLVRGEALALLGEPDQARDSFRQAEQAAPVGSDELLEAYYGQITSLDESAAGREAQLDLCVAALQRFPADLQLLCALGNFLQAGGRMDLAIRAFETAVQYGELRPSLWHLADIEDVAVVCWAATLQLQAQVAEAQRLLEDALHERPASIRIRHHLVELHIQQGDGDRAVQEAGQLPAGFPHREAFVQAVRGAGLARGGDWTAAAACLETAYEAGCRDPLCLRWLTAASLQLDKPDAARRVLSDWYAVAPEDEELARWAARLPDPPMEPAAGFTPALSSANRRIHI